MLHKLAAKRGPDGSIPPARYFSIDRVFRNESVDATHLAEFHQVEGVIADTNLTLGGLMEVSIFGTWKKLQTKQTLVHGHFLWQDGHNGSQV